MIYTITLNEHDLNNLVYAALDTASQPIGYQAKSLIEAQVLYQDSQREEIAELNATAPDVTDAPVVEAEAQQAPNVAS